MLMVKTMLMGQDTDGLGLLFRLIPGMEKGAGCAEFIALAVCYCAQANPPTQK
jgi:hypothetical protein